jgi:hypothetical protein
MTRPAPPLQGLDGAERTSLAQDSLNSEIADYGALSPQKVRAEYRGSGEAFTVSIAYDASGSAFWAASGLIPMPSSTITRSASVRLGGILMRFRHFCPRPQGRRRDDHGLVTSGAGGASPRARSISAMPI